MRIGEIIALQIQDLSIENNMGIIHVNHNWEQRHQYLKLPKNNKTRITCVPADLILKLEEIHKENPYKGGTFIFWGNAPDRPIDSRYFLPRLRKAMAAIGISREEQRQRNICFHSWRHLYNSSLRGAIQDEILRKVVGHSTEKMTDNYDHLTKENMKEVFMVMCSKLLPFEKLAA
jgi:integrase